MFSFREFSEEKDEKKALEVVMKGINLQLEGDFWDGFLSLCSNAEGMSALLDVPKEKITALSGRVSKFKNMISDRDGKSDDPAKDRLLKTGDV